MEKVIDNALTFFSSDRIAVLEVRPYPAEKRTDQT